MNVHWSPIHIWLNPCGDWSAYTELDCGAVMLCRWATSAGAVARLARRLDARGLVVAESFRNIVWRAGQSAS